MSKLSEVKYEDASTPVVERIATMVQAIVDDLDALAASVSDADAKEKISALADEYDNSSHKIVSDSIMGSPALPPSEPPKHVTPPPPPTVSKEAAEATAKATLDARKHKRASGGKPSASSPPLDHNKAAMKK